MYLSDVIFSGRSEGCSGALLHVHGSLELRAPNLFQLIAQDEISPSFRHMHASLRGKVSIRSISSGLF